MRPHLCTQCHYRNSTYLGRDELTASCDHPELQPEGRDLTVTEFQAPDWCPLGLVQPIKQGGLIDLPENPTVVFPEGDGLKKALAEWSVRGNMTHEDKPDPRTLLVPSFEVSTESATPANPNVIEDLAQEVLHSEFADVANVLAAQEQALKLHEQTLKSSRYYAESRQRMIALAVEGTQVADPDDLTILDRTAVYGDPSIIQDAAYQLDRNDPDFNLKVREAALQYERDFQRMVDGEFDHARKETYLASEPKSVGGFTERGEIPVTPLPMSEKSVGWFIYQSKNSQHCLHRGPECECVCHTSPVLHDRACCYPCPECGFRIPSVTP